MQTQVEKPLVAIACGGTGGHLFPGLAVAEQLVAQGCDVTLLISPKEVDQKAVQSARGIGIFTLPAVASGGGRWVKFFLGGLQSWRTSRRLFGRRKPQAVLAMGGFTAAPPILAGRHVGAFTCLHESNTIPGKANRWLTRVADQVYVGFPSAAKWLRHKNVVTTGTPVRPEFKPAHAAVCRAALGFSEAAPVLLTMGGSQGARGLNDLVIRSLPLLKQRLAGWQYLHLTGPEDDARVTEAYRAHGLKAVVRPFLMEMDLALGAATVGISRAGASSLAEMAAMQLPAVLVPFPAAADNHQFHNAQAYVATGAAVMLEQKNATPGALLEALARLDEGTLDRYHMIEALAAWHAPFAAKKISQLILSAIQAREGRPVPLAADWAGSKVESQTALAK